MDIADRTSEDINREYTSKQEGIHKELLKTTRTETSGSLDVIEGKPPTDISGSFYVVYPVGSVNGGGLPYPLHDDLKKSKRENNIIVLSNN